MMRENTNYSDSKRVGKFDVEFVAGCLLFGDASLELGIGREYRWKVLVWENGNEL
uniref:Uncharacterized protein n=1 Tax=Rhizophora mucronata TaxID=61149 RepID=A0A2P2MYX2_RHIMU